MKSVIITTEFRGVFFAQVDDEMDLTQTTLTNLKNCRMAIYWGTKRGVFELAEDGPNSNSKISAMADIPVLHKITSVLAVSEKAEKAWTSM